MFQCAHGVAVLQQALSADHENLGLLGIGDIGADVPYGSRKQGGEGGNCEPARSERELGGNAANDSQGRLGEFVQIAGRERQAHYETARKSAEVRPVVDVRDEQADGEVDGGDSGETREVAPAHLSERIAVDYEVSGERAENAEYGAASAHGDCRSVEHVAEDTA